MSMASTSCRSHGDLNDAVLDPEASIVDGMDESLRSPFEEVIKAMVSVSAGRMKERRRTRRVNRVKVYDNGYIFTYDKDSQCGQRSFWRCERKSECPARVHTNPLTHHIIKRINQHTHDPSPLDELPPWLLLNEDSSSPNAESNSQTGVLLPHYSPSISVTQMLEDKIMDAGSSSSDINISTPETIFNSKGDIEEAAQRPPYKKSKCDSRTESQSEKQLCTKDIDKPDSFWRIFNMTKKIINILQQDKSEVLANSSTSNDSCSSTSCSPTSTSAVLTVYMTCMPKNENDDPVYQMINLVEKTQSELRSVAEKRGLLKSSEVVTICVPGPADINVELTDDIIRTWSQESIFQVSIQKGICKITRISQ